MEILKIALFFGLDFIANASKIVPINPSKQFESADNKPYVLF